VPGRADEFDAEPLNVKLGRQQIHNFDIAVVAGADIYMENPG